VKYCTHEPGVPCGLCGHDPRPRPVEPLDHPPGTTAFSTIEGLVDNALAACREAGGGVDARMDLAAELTEIATSILVGELFTQGNT